MKIRKYESADEAALREMHAEQGFAYDFPNLEDPLFLSRMVLENGEAKPEMASVVHLTGEAYLLIDPRVRITPREKWGRFLALHEAMRKDAWAKGLSEVHCFLPPQIEKSFGRRLMQLGWKKALWPCFWTEINDG